MFRRRHPLVTGALVSVGIALVASVAIAVSTLSGHETVVNVSLTDKGGPAGQGNGAYSSDAMGVKADQIAVPRGPVSFMVTNAGSVPHEMLILPLADSQAVGTRPFGPDAKIDEAGSLGESHSEPKASSTLRVTLAPGRYELVCNHTGHYVSGMHAELTVS